MPFSIAHAACHMFKSGHALLVDALASKPEICLPIPYVYRSSARLELASYKKACFGTLFLLNSKYGLYISAKIDCC